MSTIEVGYLTYLSSTWYGYIGIFVKTLTLYHKMDQKRLNIRILSAAGMLVLASMLFFSCESFSFDPPEVDPDEEFLFAEDIAPIFTAKCASCHNAALKPDLRAANAFASLVTDAVPATKYVNAETPEESKIYTKLFLGSHASIATDIEKQMILKWIQDGAQNN
jgi:hypothetical protein